MPPAPRFLTKSRFKTGHECPTKLAYTGNPEYGDTKKDNAFLKALAEGGFQVGELAKLYYPSPDGTPGIEIATLDYAQAVAQTQELLLRENVTLYEAAIAHGNFFIRIDVLIKRGDHFQLIEAKAKSYDRDKGKSQFHSTRFKKGEAPLITEWEPYLIDAAFQSHVLKLAYPHSTVTTSLLLADKSATATVDGLNQVFVLRTDDRGRTRAETSAGVTRNQLGDRVLIEVEIDDEVKLLWNHSYDGRTFAEYVDWLAQNYASGTKVVSKIGSQCKGCEFRIGADLKGQGLKSGFEECWSAATQLSVTELSEPLVQDVWHWQGYPALLDNGTYLMRDLKESDLQPKSKGKPTSKTGLARMERQWMQVQKVAAKDPTEYFHELLREEIEGWTYPLHCIDFETALVAIPFHQGRRPYEQIAFQFSHHTLTEDGRLTHVNEYIHFERGRFPNFKFVRRLKQSLEGTTGTILRYADHENTVLGQIRTQLLNSQEPDREALIAWIETITHSSKDSVNEWRGPRDMVDLRDVVMRKYYNPATQGSNSIKKVLPAILGSSEFLQKKYGSPNYSSRNYREWQWIKKDASGSVIDPYKLLPPIFSDLDLETMDALITDGSLADGGAAMTAYARMQFTEMSDAERERVKAALLRYCELDTLAMVMIVEHWRNQK